MKCCFSHKYNTVIQLNNILIFYSAAAFLVFDLAVIVAGSLLSFIVYSFLPDTHGTKWEKFKRWKWFYVRVIAQWLSRSCCKLFPENIASFRLAAGSPRPGGEVLPIKAYTGRLRPNGMPFSGFRSTKG